jgi:hypothetical protein
MRVAGFFVRLFFCIAIAALSIVAGMWLGLTAVDNFKLVPRHKIIKVQALEEGQSMGNLINERAFLKYEPEPQSLRRIQRRLKELEAELEAGRRELARIYRSVKALGPEEVQSG